VPPSPRMIALDQVSGSLPPNVVPTQVLSPTQALSLMPATPDQPAIPDHAQNPVLPSTGPVSPGLIDVNDTRMPLASSSAPHPDVSLALLPNMVLDQSTTPAAVLPESSSAAKPRSFAVPTLAAPAPPHTSLQDGIRKPKIYSDGTIQYAYS
jgi:hypothetical protein